MHAIQVDYTAHMSVVQYVIIHIFGKVITLCRTVHIATFLKNLWQVTVTGNVP